MNVRPYLFVGLVLMLTAGTPHTAGAALPFTDPDAPLRKACIRAYAEGVDAFNHRQWAKARPLLTAAVQLGKLPDEHMAIAQQDLIIATFAESRVAEEIKEIQDARIQSSRDYLARRISPTDAENYPASNGPGNRVSFVGHVLDRHDDPVTGNTQLTVSMRRSSYDYPANGSLSGWFTVVTPGRLTQDPRAARGAEVLVRGRLIEPTGRQYGPGTSRVAVLADYLDFELEGGRGLAGPLRIDYLNFNEEQRANLPPGAR